MPSLSKAQIASIFSGNAVDWSEFGLTNPAGDNTIYVARRVSASGTQTGSRVFFLNDPCAAGVLQFVSGNDGQSATAADACNAAATRRHACSKAAARGNVEACVTNHERNHRWAISINSLEFPAASNDTTPEYAIGGGAATGNSIANKDYQRHIKIDGMSPSTFNVATSHYGNWVEATMNYSNVVGLSADAAALKTAMVAGFNDPAVLIRPEQQLQHHDPVARRRRHHAGRGHHRPGPVGCPRCRRHHGRIPMPRPIMYYTHSIAARPTPASRP